MAEHTVEITNTPDDYRAFLGVSRRRVGSLRYVPIALGAIAAMAALWGLPLLLRPHFDFNSEWPLIIGVAVALLLWVLIMRWASRIGVRRSFDKGGTFLEKKRITLADDGIHVESSLSRTHIFWLAVKDVVNARRHIFIMLDRTSGIIIPKRDFASPADADAFVATIQSHIPAKAA